MLNIYTSLLSFILLIGPNSHNNSLENHNEVAFNSSIISHPRLKKKKHKLKHRELKVHWKQFIKNMDLKKKNPDALKMKQTTVLA